MHMIYQTGWSFIERFNKNCHTLLLGQKKQKRSNNMTRVGSKNVVKILKSRVQKIRVEIVIFVVLLHCVSSILFKINTYIKSPIQTESIFYPCFIHGLHGLAMIFECLFYYKVALFPVLTIVNQLLSNTLELLTFKD